MTITDVASEVSGTVLDAEGRGVAHATVLIVPTCPQFRTRVSRRFGADVHGRGRPVSLPRPPAGRIPRRGVDDG